MPRPLCLFFVLLMCAGPAFAQPAPEALVRTWISEQVEAAADLAHAAVTERAVRAADSPFGSRRVESETHLSGTPGQPETWTRDLRALRTNGRPVPPAQRERLERRHRGRLTPPGTPPGRGGSAPDPRKRRPGSFVLPGEEALLTPAPLPLHLVRRLRPTAPPAAAEADGVPAWRLDAVTRTSGTVLDRATLWFERAGGRLLRSRLVLRPPRMSGPVVVTTEYARIEGLDVPRRRRAEGAMQMRRRLRTFTVLYTLDATYEDYTFERAPER